MTITLLDGRPEDTANIFFDPATYFFSDSATGEDLTFNIKLTDKQTFAGFVTQKWFDIASTLKNPGTGSGTGVAAGETPPSTWSNFWGQITTDPLKAPIDAVTAGAKKLFAASGTVKLMTGLAIAGIVFLIFKAASKK